MQETTGAKPVRDANLFSAGATEAMFRLLLGDLS